MSNALVNVFQVQVQQKTPHKDSKKQTPSENTAQSLQAPVEKPITQKPANSSVSNTKTSGAKPKAKKVAVAVTNDNNSNSGAIGSKTKPQPRRPKSRIAANFGGAPSQ